MTTRRAFLFGLGATLAVIPAANLMRVASLRSSVSWGEMLNENGLKLSYVTPETLAAWEPATHYAIPFELFRNYNRTVGAEIFRL